MLQPGRRRLRCPLGRHHRPLVPLVLGVAFVMIATLFTSQAAIAATPSVRLLVASTELTAERNKRDLVFVDPGAYITPVGEDFELIVNRPDYDTPITAKQVDPNSGLILRTFPDDHLDGWSGLADFAHFTVVNGHGDTVASQDVSFCPYASVRLSDQSPLTSTYPFGCYAYNPFFRGTVWGIDMGWASALAGGYYYGGGLGWKAKGDAYTITDRDRSRVGRPAVDHAERGDRRGARLDRGSRDDVSNRHAACLAPDPGRRPLREHPDRHPTRSRDAAGLLRAPRLGDRPQTRLPQLQRHGMERGARADGGRRLPRRCRVDDGCVPVLLA